MRVCELIEVDQDEIPEKDQRKDGAPIYRADRKAYQTRIHARDELRKLVIEDGDEDFEDEPYPYPRGVKGDFKRLRPGQVRAAA